MNKIIYKGKKLALVENSNPFYNKKFIQENWDNSSQSYNYTQIIIIILVIILIFLIYTWIY